jgi:hypothetical protein
MQPPPLSLSLSLSPSLSLSLPPSLSLSLSKQNTLLTFSEYWAALGRATVRLHPRPSHGLLTHRVFAAMLSRAADARSTRGPVHGGGTWPTIRLAGKTSDAGTVASCTIKEQLDRRDSPARRQHRASTVSARYQHGISTAPAVYAAAISRAGMHPV